MTSPRGFSSRAGSMFSQLINVVRPATDRDPIDREIYKELMLMTLEHLQEGGNHDSDVTP